VYCCIFCIEHIIIIIFIILLYFAAVRSRQGPSNVNSISRNNDVSASQSSLSPTQQPPPHHFRNAAAPVASSGRALHLAPPPALSTFRSDSAVLSQCALSLADDVPAAAAASTAAAAAVAAVGCGSWSGDVNRSARLLTPAGSETAASTMIGTSPHHRGGLGAVSSRSPSSRAGQSGLLVVNGHLLTSSSERVADV